MNEIVQMVAQRTGIRILRHADLGTTMNSYVKTTPKAAVEAMESFERVFTNCSPQGSVEPGRITVN
jgi:hypothetical protein